MVLHWRICKTYFVVMKANMNHRIAVRTRSLRSALGLTQEDVAQALGFGSRQIVANIESGERSVSPKELVQLASVLGTQVADLLDPFQLVGEEAAFSFRSDGAGSSEIEEFQQAAGRWLATYRELQREMQPGGISFFHSSMDLSHSSSFEQAQAAAEELRREWGLGDRPAKTLAEAIEHNLKAVVFRVEMPEGISGAATILDGLRAIFINIREAVGRQSFDLAHELFHILTWKAMPPEHIDPVQTPKKKGARVEQLANNFASALLIPAEVATRSWQRRGDVDVHDWINVEASQFLVSSEALTWRLVNLGLISRADRGALDMSKLGNNGGDAPTMNLKPFSRSFIARICEATNEGRISLRRAMTLLDLGEVELFELFDRHGVESVYASSPT